MNTHILLYQLRERLRMVKERIMERSTMAHETCNNSTPGNNLYCALATGALLALRSEAAFLAGLIADIEDEEVAPEDSTRYSVIADLPERHEQEGQPANL